MLQLRAAVITLFPKMFEALQEGVIGRAQVKGYLQLKLYSLRDFSENKHHRVDDRPYGGGEGMVLAYPPLLRALKQAKADFGPDAHTRVVYLSPRGLAFDSEHARQVVKALSSSSKPDAFIFIAGRYEGIDQRFIDAYVDESWSIGNYVISGGELAAMVVLDALTRFIPGVLGNPDSQYNESYSFSQGLLDYPHYTRPQSYQGMAVPSPLLSGDHQAIDTWRLQQALGQTFLYRPDLLTHRQLSTQETVLLTQFLRHYHHKGAFINHESHYPSA